MPIRFLYKGTCLKTCPDNDLNPSLITTVSDLVFEPLYDNYTCKEQGYSVWQNQTKALSVRFVPMGYRKRLPKDQILYFRAAISNINGNVTAVNWKQMEPAADLSAFTGNKSFWTLSDTKNLFIFDGLTTMDATSAYLQTKTAYQKLRMSSFNYFDAD